MFYFIGLFLFLYVFSRITGMMDWVKEPGTKGWLLGMGVFIVSAFVVTALWLKSEFDDSGDIDKLRSDIDKLRSEINNPQTGLAVELRGIKTNVDILMSWYKSEIARETSFDAICAQATSEEQRKLWKAKPLFDIEYARLLKKHGSIDALKKELPALKQRLLDFDEEKKSPDSPRENTPNDQRGKIEQPVEKKPAFEKLPLPPK